MPDERPVKLLQYRKAAEGRKKVGRPLPRFMDNIKDILKQGDALNTWTENGGDGAICLNGASYRMMYVVELVRTGRRITKEMGEATSDRNKLARNYI